ncbi:MAG: coproporphyrinogen III oxidase, partial [Bacteroidaceae bacterium]|nr:coproporphyrinogen III oxidase [Bacteroidaceae bacterium]
RTAAGLDLAAFASNFGQEKLDALLARANPYINNGTLAITGGHLRLTREGLFVSDDIISSLFE